MVSGFTRSKPLTQTCNFYNQFHKQRSRQLRIMSKKRTLDSFFTPDSKKQRKDVVDETVSDSTHNTWPPSLLNTQTPTSTHPTYSFPIPELPSSISQELPSWPPLPGKEINDQPDLDLLYFEPFVPSYVAKDLFKFLRSQLPFYRVE